MNLHFVSTFLKGKFTLKGQCLAIKLMNVFILVKEKNVYKQFVSVSGIKHGKDESLIQVYNFKQRWRYA